MEFKTLHRQDNPLVIANVWDVPSAKIAEALGFQAMATSSSAIASMLGYLDGEAMSFSELEYLVQRICASTKLPLSVDLESGYSRKADEIVDHIRCLEDLGVVGINIEDSVVTGKRSLLEADQFARLLSEIVGRLRKKESPVFVNVRTDTFLLGIPDTLAETKKRMVRYENAGANGIFVPYVEKVTDIEQIVSCTTLPLNVMCMPQLPDFKTLSHLGVKRISMGNFVFETMYRQCKAKTKEILTQGSFKPIF